MNTDYATSEGTTTTSVDNGSYDQADWATYETGGKSFELPADDVYTLRTPSVITDNDITKGDVGQIKASISPLTIVGGKFNGYELKFFVASNKKYRNRNASGLGDFLLAANSPHRPTTDESWRVAVKALSNRTLQAKCRWEGYNKVTRQEFVGMEAFPLVDGKRQPFIDFRNDNNEAISAAEAKTLGRDATYRVWANLKVARVIIPGK